MNERYQALCATDNEPVGFANQPGAYALHDKWLCRKHLPTAVVKIDTNIPTICPTCFLYFRGGYGVFVHKSKMHKEEVVLE